MTPPLSNAIETLRLSKHLDGRRVLHAIDLTLAMGECVALMGSNGGGKTTLLRCMAGVVRPTEGEVRWFGRPAAEDPAQRRLVGMAGHASGLYGHLTLRENLLFAARMGRLREPNRLADRLLEQIGLGPMAGRQVRQLSQGMRQRVTLARVLIHDPQVLLLDEPFTGLDEASRDWLVAVLREQRASGRAICFATHDENHSRSLADRILVLQDGRLQAAAAVTPTRAETGSWRYAS